MAAPWVAVAADIRRSHKMTSLPSDTARYGWIVALCEAKLLDRNGTFTVGQWTEVMGRYGKYLDDYIDAGLLHDGACHSPHCNRGRAIRDGSIVVHDWPDYQREHARRQAEYKARSDAESDTRSDIESDTPGDSESDAPSRALSLSPVNSPLSSNSDGGVGEVGESAFEAYHRLTVKPPSAAVISWLDRLCDEHPESRVVEVMVSEWRAKPDPSDFLGRVQTRLAVLGRSQAKAKQEDTASRAIREQEEARRRYEQATPEERARQDEMRAKIAGLVQGMP